jgi:hypothetical protein
MHLKSILASLLGGLILGAIVAMTGEQLSHMLHPEFSIAGPNPDELERIFDEAPTSAILLRLLGWIVAPGLAAWASVRLYQGDALPGLITGMVLVTLGMLFGFLLPYPWWARMSLFLALPLSMSLGIMWARTQMRRSGTFKEVVEIENLLEKKHEKIER